jgi:N-terminal cysteine-rich region of Transmembrane protein 135
MTLENMPIEPADIKVLQPVLRAYALGYLASTGPRLFGFLKTARREDITLGGKLEIFATILRTSTQIHKFPTAAALIVAGVTSIPRLLFSIIRWLTAVSGRQHPPKSLFRRLKYFCTLLSAWFAFDLLNRDKVWVRKRAQSRGAADVHTSNLGGPNQYHLPPPPYHAHYAGKTIDFTLFAFFRALDVLVITVWRRTRSRNWHPEQYVPGLAEFAKTMADPWVFASSACIIMWSWFYSPHCLPRAYNKWISTAAEIDSRLIKALRLYRQGEIVYGQDTGQAPLLQSLCDELGLPQEWGDPAKAIPIPCEVVHSGAGSSCEVHALSRARRSFLFSMKLYLPLQLLTKMSRPSRDSFMVALKGALRSSSFLASFVTLFYYSVCLARTRLGPKLLSYKTITPQMWDAGLCVLAGCLTCGWSILLEKPNQRQELAFFVAPRALATLLPRVYDRKHQRREQAAFALSIAIVLNAVQSAPENTVRGVLGRVLRRVLEK